MAPPPRPYKGWWVGSQPLDMHQSWPAPLRWLVDIVLAVYKFFFVKGRLDPTTTWTKPHWDVAHSQWRWWHALFCYVGPPSHVLWNVKVPLASVMAVAVGVCFFNDAMRAGRLPKDTWFAGMSTHVLDIWRLGSFTLSLMLSFRIRAAYDRWWTGRQAFGTSRSANTQMYMQATMWVKDPALVEDIYRWATIWPCALYQTVYFQKKLNPKADALLTPEEREMYYRSTKVRNTAAYTMRRLIAQANLPPAQLLAMEETWRQAYLEGSNLARMRLTGLPYAVALVSSGLLFIWLLLLPCQYIGTDGLNWASLMVVFVLSLLLLALDEVANQLEDCWYSLPMGRMLDRGFEDIKRVREEYLLAVGPAAAVAAKKAPAAAETVISAAEEAALAAAAVTVGIPLAERLACGGSGCGSGAVDVQLCIDDATWTERDVHAVPSDPADRV